MPVLRVLDATNMSQQRLGYLKHIVARCASLETSSLQALGHDLIDAVSRKVTVELTPPIAEYIRARLTDGIYRKLREQAMGWQSSVQGMPSPRVQMELQDLYLASPTLLPSRTGKLGSRDARNYPQLATKLSFVRSGTWSLLDRGAVLHKLTSPAESRAYEEYTPNANPFVLSQGQKVVMSYSFLENDGDVISRLYHDLSLVPKFSDRDAGDLLPQVLRDIVHVWWNRTIPVEERDRLDRIARTADSIERRRDMAYTGATAREHASRPRLEPFVDLGFLSKDDPYRFEYCMTCGGRRFVGALDGLGDLHDFLHTRFFRTWASSFGPAHPADASRERLRAALTGAWQDLRSRLGYAPIVDTALLAGIHLLTEESVCAEISTAIDEFRAWQKEEPSRVRFSVDRMGNLANVRLIGL